MQKMKARRSSETSVTTLHDHPLYLVCPGLLRAVGEIYYGVGWGSSNRT